MKFELYSHRHALQILKHTPEYSPLLSDIFSAIENTTEERIAEHFVFNYQSKGKAKKSISESINQILKIELISAGWTHEAPIFREADFGEGKWRLDFAKQCDAPEGDFNGFAKRHSTGISIEVGFNHSGSIAWNLLKPVLASELNHVEKAIQTSVGVVIAASRELQEKGGFDKAIGVYEDYVSHVTPLRDVLSVPILIVGLRAPETFKVRHEKRGNSTYGFIEPLT